MEILTEFTERMPQTIIDDSDPLLFKMMKEAADTFFDGEINERLVYELIKRGRMVRFSHDFKNEKLYIDFPKSK